MIVFSRGHRLALSLIVAIGFTPSLLYADWNLGDPYKWLQKPYLTATNLGGVNMTNRLVADDFECTYKEWLKDFHFWAWWDGVIDRQTSFDISIYSDIPAAATYSRPGTLLWTQNFTAAEYTSREYATGIYQYNFDVLSDWFYQTGTVEQPVTYWLAIEAVTSSGSSSTINWLTSLDVWNDKAVAYDVNGWNIYADGLAFVITVPEPSSFAVLLCGFIGLAAAWRKRK